MLVAILAVSACLTYFLGVGDFLGVASFPAWLISIFITSLIFVSVIGLALLARWMAVQVRTQFGR